MRRIAIAFLLLVACTPDPPVGSRAGALTHTYDLASQMPKHLAIMFVMAWFGLPAGEPGIVSPDAGYHNWKWSTPSCGGIDSNPAECATAPTGSYQRRVASRYRPLAGIYSSSGSNEESRRRMDLMLSTLRRPCESGARLDAFGVQLNGTYGTSLHPGNKQAGVAEVNLKALEGLLDRAETAGLQGAVMPANDGTWYFHFPAAVGLDCAGDKQSCLDAVSQDIVDMVKIASGRSGAVQIDGKPVLLFYIDGALTSAQDWEGIVAKARQGAVQDFYLIGAHAGPGHFSSFDAIAPWIEFYWWDATSGATVREHARAYAAKLHDPLLAALPGHPGRVVFGGVSPGFDDFTRAWGDCKERQLPHAGQGAGPRDPAFLDGQLDYLKSKATGFQGVLANTWDDWTEGSHFEPDVANGTKVLLQLRERLGELYGEAADPAGATQLDQRWKSFGQPRGCNGSTPVANPPGPALDLKCAATLDRGTARDSARRDGSPDPTSEAGGAQDRNACRDCTGAPEASGGCSCEVGAAREAGALGLLLLALALAISFARCPCSSRSRG